MRGIVQPVSTVTDTPAVRGRPREFDTDEVLDEVVRVFWRRGYEATAISDIVKATGLNKSSLYNAFGSKEELFTLAVERYISMRVAMMKDILVAGSGGLDDIGMFIDLQEAESMSDDECRGCLALNSSSELGTRVNDVVGPLTRFRAGMRDGIGAALWRASEAGEIDSADVPTYTEVLLSMSVATAILTKAGASTDELDGHFAAMRATVDGWRR